MPNRGRRHNRGEVCPDCGIVHPQCLAHRASRDPETGLLRACNRKPTVEMENCYLHGGNSPKALEKRERERAVARAEGELGKLLEEMGEVVTPGYLDGLHETYAKAYRMRAALGCLVGRRDSPLGRNRFGEEVVHPLVALLGEWSDRCTGIETAAVKLGIDLRRQQLDEQNVEHLFQGVRKAIDATGLTPGQERTFLDVLADFLDPQ